MSDTTDLILTTGAVGLGWWFYRGEQERRLAQQRAIAQTLADAARKSTPVAPTRNATVDKGPFVTFEGIKTYDDMYIAQYKYLRDQRGFDMLPGPTQKVAGEFLGGGTMAVPRTTNGDVLQLATYWSHAFSDARAVLDDHDQTEREWNEVLADIDKHAKGADPNAVYSGNNVLWRVLDNVSSNVSVAAKAPTRWDLFVGALEKSIKDLPENLVKEVEWVGGRAKDVVVDVAGAAGSAANTAIKGLFSGITTPFLVGGGVLAAVLLLRNRDDQVHAGEG
jgi:hypothetical protein